MKTKMQKALLLSVCAVVLVVASILGTAAYFSAKTTMTNTFVAGKIDASSSEQKVDEYGEPVDPAERTEGVTQEQQFKLIPGHTYTKDPTITIGDGSEACYLFARVKNELTTDTATVEVQATQAKPTIAAQIAANGWTALTDATITDSKIYYKLAPANDTGDDVDYVIFENLYVDAAKTATELAAFDGKTITVTTYAIQQDGFADAAAAWAVAKTLD